MRNRSYRDHISRSKSKEANHKQQRSSRSQAASKNSNRLKGKAITFK